MCQNGTASDLKDIPWKTRTVKLRLDEWQRLGCIWGKAIALSNLVGVMGRNELCGGV